MTETVTWIDADGVSTDLEVEWNTSGRFAPPTLFDEEGVPEQDGARLRNVRHGVREFVLPLWITGATESALRTAMRDLVKAMNPKRGAGKIRVMSPVGDEREIICSYADGLDMRETLGETSGLLVQRAPVVFRAHSPYWQAVSDISDTYTSGDPAPFFSFFPLRLSSSTVFADASPDNTGDVDAWPVWTITGPGSAIVLRNLTTGYSLTLNTTLGASETVTIDTRPGFKAVTRGDGTNLFTSLEQSTSYLWPLTEGANSVRIEMSSATAASSVTLAFRPRYLSP